MTHYKLGNICHSITDGDHQSIPVVPSGIPFVITKNIDAATGKLVFSDTRFVSNEYWEAVPTSRKPQDGDVLLTVKGSFGIPAYVDTGKAFVFQRDIALLRPNQEYLFPRFLFYWLNDARFQAWANATAVGTAQRALTLTMLRNLDIDLPMLDEQKRIASILMAYDNLIENNCRQIALLEEAAQRLYKEWFVDLHFPGNESDGAMGSIPDGWAIVELKDIAGFISRGITPKYTEDSDQLVLGQRCVRNNLIEMSFARHHAPKAINDKWLRWGDVLVNSTGTGSLGRTAQIWFEPNNIVVDSHVTIIRANKPLHCLYIGFWCFNHENDIERLHTGSTGQTELPRDRLKTIRLLNPRPEVLERFNRFVEPITKRILAAQEECNNLMLARDLLLPKLMSGEIDVANVAHGVCNIPAESATAIAELERGE